MAKKKVIKKSVLTEAVKANYGEAIRKDLAEPNLKLKKEQTTEEKARAIKYLETKWCDGHREAHQIIRKDSLKNPDHLHRSIRTHDGEKGFCVLIFG